MQVKVWDKKSNIERTMPEKAYLILQKRYDFITYLDEAGTPTEGLPKGTLQKKSVKEDVPLAESRIVVRKSPEEITAKKAELEAQNQQAIAAAQEKFEEQVETPEVKVRKKPGPKPKSHA